MPDFPADRYQFARTLCRFLTASAPAASRPRRDRPHRDRPQRQRRGLIPAQGNALDKPISIGKALKGRDDLRRSSRADFLGRRQPRALPWAGLFQGFQPTSNHASPK